MSTKPISRRTPLFVVVYLILSFSSAAFGQWMEQRVDLKPGWNSVYLHVEPYPSESALQFDALPVQRVWTYDARFSPEQFIKDADKLLEPSPTWRAYFPTDSGQSFATNLFHLRAGGVYLISASEECQWTVRGRPILIEYEWNPDAYNLVGFPVDDANPPSFGKWFESSSAHQPLDVWRLRTDGSWSQIASPSSEKIQKGCAYWVYTSGSTTYQGPLRIELPTPEQLYFTEDDVENDVKIQHTGSGSRTVTLEVLPSASVPQTVGGTKNAPPAPNAGDVILTHYSRTEGGEWLFEFVDFPLSIDYEVSERNVHNVRTAVERDRMSPSPSDAWTHQGILIVRDNIGCRLEIGIVAEPRTSQPPEAFKPLLRSKGLLQEDAAEDAGLWMGNVTVNKVVEPNILFDDPDLRKGVRLPNTGSDALTEAPVEFSFGIIVHIDSQGTARLLSEVTQLFRQEETVQDPNDPTRQILVEDGRPVLMTANAPQELTDMIGNRITGVALRDGRPFANRVTSPMFSLRDEDGQPECPVMNRSGSIFTTGNTLEISLRLEDSDPRNPFHHQYHTMHRYPTAEDNPPETKIFNIDRTISLSINNEEQPPDGLNESGVGDTQVCGTYRESLLGLRHDPIYVEGYFRMYRVSKIPVLNDGLGFVQ